MLSHDNLTWESLEMREIFENDRPEIKGKMHKFRTITYLPLSHIAGLKGDIMGHLYSRSELYFARPDAFQGSIAKTMKDVRPTFFFAVPRIWEKFEDKMKEVAAQAPACARRISGWAKGHGTAGIHALINGTKPSMMHSVASGLILSKIRKAIGLDECIICFTAAAPLRQSTQDYFTSLGMPLVNIYGMSETTGPMTTHSFGKFSITSAGWCIPGCDLKIVNPD